MKTAFVTGATSGIGKAKAGALAAADWQVIVTERHADRLAPLVEEFGDRIHPAVFDIRDEAALATALDDLPERFRGIDLLVNNTGLALGTATAQRSDLEQWRTMIDTNVTALVPVTHRLLPGPVERRSGIINIASVEGTYPYAGGNV